MKTPALLVFELTAHAQFVCPVPGQFVKLCVRDKSVCENFPQLFNHEEYFDPMIKFCIHIDIDKI